MTFGRRDRSILFTPAHSGYMKSGQGFSAAQTNELEILVFALGGITLGVDTEQVGGVIPADEAEALGMKLVPFSEKIPLGEKPERLQAPKALMINDVTPYAVIIKSPDDILSVRLDSIRPLPPLLAACNACQAVWGVAVREEGIIILIDFLRLHDMHNQNNNTHLAFLNKGGEATT